MFPLEYDIDRILVAGQPAILAGPSKGLKTTLAIDLGLSLASGEPFLGAFRVNRQRRVLLMSGESGSATIQETARRIMLAKNGELRHVDDFMYCQELPSLSRKRDLAAC
jgi:RecA-family ATPase